MVSPSTPTTRVRAFWHRIGMHRWITVLDTVMHRYQRCDICGRRRIVRMGTRGHQPRDLQWIETGKFREFRPPRPTPPAPRSAVLPPVLTIVVKRPDQLGPVEIPELRRERIE